MEHGALARTWNHRIRLGTQSGPAFEYTDQIDIHAGVMSPLIWLFAQLFNRQRQLCSTITCAAAPGRMIARSGIGFQWLAGLKTLRGGSNAETDLVSKKQKSLR